MSAISDIFDNLTTLVTDVLPDHRELINPYFPEIDSELTYEKAFGVAFAEGVNLLGNENSGVEQRQQTFIVTLTRRKFALKADIATRKATERALLEDTTLVLDSLATVDGTSLAGSAQRALYSSHGGIEFLRVDQSRNDILLIRIIITVDYEQEVDLCV